MCDCITNVNGRLAEHNTMIVFNLFGTPLTFVETCKVSSKVRGKPISVAATYCPFCGDRYEAESAMAVLHSTPN